MAVDKADLRMKIENEIKSCLGMGGTRVLDLNTMNLSVSDYLEMVKGKTAALFSSV